MGAEDVDPQGNGCGDDDRERPPGSLSLPIPPHDTRPREVEGGEEMTCAECNQEVAETVALPDGRGVCYGCLFERPGSRIIDAEGVQELLRRVHGDQVKVTIQCPYCGGVDAHRYNCKGGYGL